jgi:uncharacterized protein (DUF1800 family)
MTQFSLKFLAWLGRYDHMPTPATDVAHLLRRVGFGALPAEIAALTPLSWAQAVDHVLDTSSAPPLNSNLPNLDPNRGGWERYVDMTHFWMERCRTTPAPLAEKMVLFWHGHLCSSLDKVGDHQAIFEQNQVFRAHGLGSFETLLREVSLQPAMIRYLDNDVNVAGSPNENFARELMELFTLGVGHYTEEDVRESARAWTGHGVNDDTGRYVFRSAEHDDGQKTFMGITQNWDGPQIITHLLNGAPRTQTSRFVATKLWSFFAYPDPDAAVIDTISAAFRASNMRIDALVRAILMHPEFLSTRARQGLVRSPIDYAVAAMRHTGLDSSIAHPEWTLEGMGQEPFYPPDVSGWRPNEYWISAPAMWAKSGFASRMRWKGIDAGNLANTRDLSIEAAANAALALHGIDQPSAATMSALRNFIEEERDSSRWAEQAGLLYLSLLTPEFQLA